MAAKKKQGFASMSPERQREIAAMGGRAVPAEKRSFSQNRVLAAQAGTLGGQSVPAHKRTFNDRELAKRAGQLGGSAVPAEKRSFSRDPEFAAECGRLAHKR